MGYALKRAQHALHSTMDGELRDYGLSVSQYACLQILASRPRISNADLARDAFVSRQAMHQLLTGLQATGLVSAVGQGRGQRYALTAEGHTRLHAASSTVAAIEQRMLATLSRAEREQLHRQLSVCATALGLKPGTHMLLSTENDGSLRLRPYRAVAEQSRGLLRGLPGGSMVDELLAERRAEAEREDTE